MMVSQVNDDKTVQVRLPNGKLQQISVRDHATVSDLKAICECSLGIPSELMKIFDEASMTDEELTDNAIIISNTIHLQVPIWWNKVISSILNGDFQSVYRRVQLSMQQVGQNERLFVAMFMGCCRGMDELVTRLVQLKNDIDLSASTDSRRTLLHACAMGGNLKCLEIVVKHLLKGNYASFGVLDNNKQTAVQLAEKMGHSETAQLLLKYAKDSEESPELLITNVKPHQRQANTNRKINNDSKSNERYVDVDKHVHKSNDYTNNSSNDPIVSEHIVPTNSSNALTSDMSDESTITSQKSSSNDKVVDQAGPTPSGLPAQNRLDQFDNKPRLRRVREQNPNLIVKVHVEEEESAQNTTYLPSLITGYERKNKAVSLPNSPIITPRTSPVNDVIDYCKSAPNSPTLTRRRFRAAGLAAQFAVTPNPPARIREKWNDSRRSSLAIGTEHQKFRERKKSRSVCEVTLRESFGAFHKTMETEEERIDLPWNAWIAAKRQENLAPIPVVPNQLKPPQSPGQGRRRSFVQWLNDKDLDALRKQHAEFQLGALEEEGTSDKKGKSFEEWLEEKHMESKKEKEREKQKEEELKNETESKMRRRRMSQQKYQSWLQAKELKALEAEEKLLGEAKTKFEKMKIKWEEEDEVKKRLSMGQKVNVSRTKSCPTAENNSKISRHRFSSLKSK